MKRISEIRGIGALTAAVAFAAFTALPTGALSAAAPTLDSRGFPVGYRCYQNAGHDWSCYTATDRVPPRERCYFDGARYRCYLPSARLTAHSKLPPGLECNPVPSSDAYLCSEPPEPSPPPPPPPPWVKPR